MKEPSSVRGRKKSRRVESAPSVGEHVMSGVKSCYSVRKIRAKSHLLDLATVASLVVLMGEVCCFCKEAGEEASGLEICGINERAQHSSPLRNIVCEV